MLEQLDYWLDGPDGAPYPSDLNEEDRRQAERYRLTSGEVFLFVEGDERYRLRLRDLCRLGAAGLTDAPLGVGERIIVQLEEMLMPAAQVVWTRRAMVGLAFLNPVPIPRIKRLCERHSDGAAWSPAMRAGSDMHGWWTDVEQHGQGRKPRLRSGGHKNPLPR